MALEKLTVHSEIILIRKSISFLLTFFHIYCLFACPRRITKYAKRKSSKNTKFTKTFLITKASPSAGPLK